MSKKQLMKKLSFLFLPFCFTLSVNQCLSQVVQVRLDRIEIKEYDTIYIAIQPLFSNDTLEIIPITSTDNEFTIDYKFATGDNILSFEYTNEAFSFEIELEAQKTDRTNLLNSANGVWYFHRVADKEQRRVRRIKLNYCGFKDSLFWNYRDEPITLERNGGVVLANEIGKADFHACVTDPVSYNSNKQVSSCPSRWFVNYGSPQLLIKVDNSGQTMYTFRIKKNRMILNQVDFDENGYSIRGRRYILKKKRK